MLRDDDCRLTVAHHTADNAFELVFQLLHEQGGIVVTILYLTELLFPDACQLWAFQQVCPDSVYQRHTHVRGHQLLLLPTDISALDDGLYNPSP